MKLDVDLQNTLENVELPDLALLELWILTALQAAQFNQELVEITVRIVDEAESQMLNNTYRQQNKPTNILSFPFEVPAEIDCDLLGDLVICLPVVEKEAAEQKKSLTSHWAHLLVHGSLHLLGFDHLENDEAEEMESLEVLILNRLGFANPYLEIE